MLFEKLQILKIKIEFQSLKIKNTLKIKIN